MLMSNYSRGHLTLVCICETSGIDSLFLGIRHITKAPNYIKLDLIKSVCIQISSTMTKPWNLMNFRFFYVFLDLLS